MMSSWWWWWPLYSLASKNDSIILCFLKGVLIKLPDTQASHTFWIEWDNQIRNQFKKLFPQWQWYNESRPKKMDYSLVLYSTTKCNGKLRDFPDRILKWSTKQLRLVIFQFSNKRHGAPENNRAGKEHNFLCKICKNVLKGIMSVNIQHSALK